MTPCSYFGGLVDQWYDRLTCNPEPTVPVPPFVSDGVQHAYSDVCVYGSYGSALRSVDSVSLSAVDWVGFHGWLTARGLRQKYVYDLMNYARKYGGLLFSGRLSELEGVKGSRMALASLANLSRFLGKYSTFKEMRLECGLQWNRSSTEDVFAEIYDGRQSISSTEEWLESLRCSVGWDVYFPACFLALSGLRTSEGCDALNLVARGALNDGYYNESLCVLEHFRFKKTFLRTTKKTFVSVLAPRMLKELQEWRTLTTYGKLRSRVLRRGIGCRFYDLRKMFASVMRLGGIEAEFCDLLQGRVGSSVFVRSYLRPDMRDVIERVRAILAVQENRWIG